MKIYAGIGSRETPPDILDIMERLARKLSLTHILRSGGAIGADTAFERGCTGAREIFLAKHATPAARYLASEFHRLWESLPEYAQNLHGRNAMILLGKNLDNPVEFVVCWTKDGRDTGGTGMGIRIATSRGIRVCNLFYPEWKARIEQFISTGTEL